MSGIAEPAWAGIARMAATAPTTATPLAADGHHQRRESEANSTG